MANKKVAEIQRFVETRRNNKFWIGMDVHKKSYSIALKTADECRTLTHPADPERFTGKLKEWGLNIKGIAYEAGPTGFKLARTLTAAGYQVTVAAPSRIPRPVTPGAKTDRLDCIKLADYLMRGMLKAIAVPTRDQEAERGLARRRDQLTDDLRRVKQRIKSLLLRVNVPEPAGLEGWSQAGIARLRQVNLAPADRLTMGSLLRQMKEVQKELALVTKQIKAISQSPEHRKVIACLQTVPGVGPVVASKFRLELFEPGRFSRAEEVTSYLGLAPMVHQSGNRSSPGKLRPVGQKRLRSLLIEAAWIFRAKVPWAREFYNKRLAGTGLAQKAIAALARKLAVILWRLSVEQRPFYLAVEAKG